MCDVSKLVRRKHLAPRSELADVVAGLGRRRPENDDWMIEDGKRETIRDVEWVFDDDLNAAGRRIADETRHSRVDRRESRGDELSPGRELRRVVHVELTGVDGMPTQPGSGEELSGEWARQKGKKERRAEQDGAGAPEKTKGRAPRPVPSSSAIAEHYTIIVKRRAPPDGPFRGRVAERQNPSTTFPG